jgi:imidazolonepropionase-like amidohydrolase
MIVRRVLVASLVLLGGCAEPRPSVDVRLPADPPAALIVRDVAVLDVAGGVLLPARDVLLADGRIAAIGPAGAVSAPAGVQEISGAGAALVPGLVDMHGHIDADPAPTWVTRRPDHAANLRSYLYCGVTTVFDPGDSTGDAFARRDRVAAGELIGPRIFTAGPIHTADGGHPIALVREFAPWWIGWYLAPRVAVALDSPADAAEAVDALAAQGPDAVKIVIDAIPLEAPRLRREIAAAVVERATSHGLRVVAHIGSAEDAIDAAEAGVAAWVHGVYKEPLSEADVTRLVGYGIPMVATIEVFERYARTGTGPREPSRLEREVAPAALLASFHPVPDGFGPGSLASWLELAVAQQAANRANVGRLHRAGMTILAGSDSQSGVFPGPGLHRELHHLVAAGLSPVEAIRAATLDAARFLADGEEPEFGAVEVGKRADLLLVEGDPTRDMGALEQIREVFVAGVALERTPVAEVVP